MRDRDRILDNLETLYREAFERARDAEEASRMAELDFGFQRDQLFLEAILDVRDLLAAGPEDEEDEEDGEGPSLLERARALKRLPGLGR